MTQDLGLHFIVGITGDSLSYEEAKRLSILNPAGVILFKDNITTGTDWPDRLRTFINDIRQVINRHKIIVSIDHEGGRVHRLREPISHFPPAFSWGDLTEEVGQKMGEELASLGINLDYAPSLDVLSEESNTVIGDRAFSDDPEIAALRGVEFLRGLRSADVMGCGKHFPGHGGTVADSHFELPVLDRSEDDIRAMDLPPFIAAIQNGLSLMMTAHVVYPALDADNPATLSPKILTGLLRNQLGFKGCVISDALEMKAVAQTEDATLAEQFIRAGGDLFLLGQKDDHGTPTERALKIKEQLAALSSASADFQSLLEGSGRRVRSLLGQLP